jgi:hypothetical protein
MMAVNILIIKNKTWQVSSFEVTFAPQYTYHIRNFISNAFQIDKKGLTYIPLEYFPTPNLIARKMEKLLIVAIAKKSAC